MRRHPSIFLMITGLLSVVVGVLALINPGDTYTAVAKTLAILVLISGVIRIASYMSKRSAHPFNEYVSGWTLVLGVLELLLSVLMFLNASAVMLTLALIVGLWTIVRAAFVAYVAWNLKRHHVHSWAWMMALALLQALLAVLLLVMPGLQPMLVAGVVGVLFVTYGVFDIAAAFTKA